MESYLLYLSPNYRKSLYEIQRICLEAREISLLHCSSSASILDKKYSYSKEEFIDHQQQHLNQCLEKLVCLSDMVNHEVVKLCRKIGAENGR